MNKNSKRINLVSPLSVWYDKEKQLQKAYGHDRLYSYWL